MIRRILFLFCFLVMSLAATQAQAGGPRLTLLFCANNDAEVRPCPS